MQMPQVSVLIPLYNTQEAHLRAAIESVLAQTFKDFELVLLNDSPENAELERIVSSYRDERIRYCANERNLGLSASRNRLLQMARGAYLAVMDHDDVAMPERLEKQVAFLDSHPEIGVVGANVQNMGERGNTTRYPTAARDVKLGLMSGCVVPHTCAMIRREVLDRTGIMYEEEYSPAEDYALWCRLIPHTQFANLPEPLCRYRLHAGNTSKIQSRKMWAAHCSIRAMVRTAHPDLYHEFLLTATHTTRIHLLGIPVLKITGPEHRRRYFLFSIIPILTVKRTVKL